MPPLTSKLEGIGKPEKREDDVGSKLDNLSPRKLQPQQSGPKLRQQEKKIVSKTKPVKKQIDSAGYCSADLEYNS